MRKGTECEDRQSLPEPFRNHVSSLREELDIKNNILLDVVQSKKNDWIAHGFLTRNFFISSGKIYENFKRHSCRFSYYLAQTNLLHWIPRIPKKIKKLINLKENFSKLRLENQLKEVWLTTCYPNIKVRKNNEIYQSNYTLPSTGNKGEAALINQPQTTIRTKKQRFLSARSEEIRNIITQKAENNNSNDKKRIIILSFSIVKDLNGWDLSQKAK